MEKSYVIYKMSCELNARKVFELAGKDENIINTEEFKKSLVDYIFANDLHVGNYEAPYEEYETLEEAELYFDENVYLTRYEGYAFPYYLVEWYELWDDDEEAPTQIK